ncbi:MAG: M28 family peptidase [Desulfitobacteriaceae bacterium]|nr:M28 family peptidase [Desulfitobacteriaceae bacterium]
MKNSHNISEKELVQEVNADYLMDYTTNIAKYIRLSGSPEELESFRYIEEKLNFFGLKTSLTFSDAYISLPLDSNLTIAGVDYPCVTASMAAPTGEDGIDAEMLYVGDFSSFSEMSAQAKGKAVVIHGFAGRVQAQKAAQAGAAACIFINGERLHNMIVSPVWGNPTPETFPLIPKISIVSVNKYDGAEVIKEAKKGSVAHIVTRIDAGWRKIPTLIAEIKGQIEPEKFILFSGHVDSWYYGAMDNASANAAMMEVGRILANKPLRRSLRLAFWSGHSHGRYAGSTYYMDHNFLDFYNNCLLHINIDSVGAKGATVVTEGNIMPLTKALAARVIKEQTGQDFVGKAIGRGGDQSFWGAGVPSAFMSFSGQPLKYTEDDLDTQYMIKQFNNGPQSSGFGWWWHSPEDTIDKIDPTNLQRDARVFLSFVLHSCHDPLFTLDLSAGIKEIKKHLDEYREKAGEHISLNNIDDALQALSNIAVEIEQLSCGDIDEELQKKLNEASHTVRRVIVRLMQVGTSEFDPDAALAMPGFPLLASINQLAETEKDKHQYMMLLTKIQRRINQTVFLLTQGAKTARYILKSCSDRNTI